MTKKYKIKCKSTMCFLSTHLRSIVEYYCILILDSYITLHSYSIWYMKKEQGLAYLAPNLCQ